MQITKEVLQKFAETTVEKLTRVDHTILAVYKTGSMVTEESPLLGGAADIDLVFIHIGDPKIDREILRLTDDVHLDIAHHPQRDYLQRLELRTHPWMGPTLSEGIPMYDPQHFLGLTQASVRGLYHRAGNVVQRATASLEKARDLWFEFQPPPENPDPQDVYNYFRILKRAANAVALLAWEPLTELRFLLNFATRTERIDRPGMVAGLMGMLGAPRIEDQILTAWVSAWDTMFDSLSPEDRHPRLNVYRKSYYSKAFDALMGSGEPKNVLWPLIRTWTLAAQTFEEGDPNLQAWKDVCQALGLIGAEFGERILALDAFLDQVQEGISVCAAENGG
jgi:hypothetical protein